MRPLARLLSLAVALAGSACTTSASSSSAPAERDAPLCGGPAIGDPWPDPGAGAGADTTTERRGRLEAFESSVLPVLRCGSRVAGTVCRVTLLARPSMFGAEVGVSVDPDPPATARALLSRVRERTLRAGFVERGVPSPSPTTGTQGAVAAFARGTHERALALVCVGDGRCSLEIVEEEKDCDAPGGPVPATLAPESASDPSATDP